MTDLWEEASDEARLDDVERSAWRPGTRKAGLRGVESDIV